MQKKHLLLGSALGGTLLATTALTSAASAQTLAVIGDTGFASPGSFGDPVSTERFAGASGSSTSLGELPIVYNLSSTSTNATVTLAIRASTGAFTTSATNATALPSAANISASFAEASSLISVGSLTAASCGNVGIVGGLLSVTCTSGSAASSGAIAAISIESVAVTQAQALATSGTSLNLTASLYNGSTVTSGALISSSTDTLTLATSGNPVSLAAQTATGLVSNATATPAFSLFTGGTATGDIGGINITLASTSLPNFTAQENIANLLPSANGLTVNVAHDAFLQSGFTSVSVEGGTQSATQSAGGFTSGNSFTATLDPDGGIGTAFTAAGSVTSVNVNVVFDGTTAIEAAAAGTISATFSGTFTSALATASGSLAAITRNGISTELNMLQSSSEEILGSSAYQSYVRITNSGAVAGAASIVILDASDGSTLGTATTDSIPVNSTVQLSSADLETSAGIDAIVGQYNVLITGPFQGYAQHVMLNGTNQFFSDLTGFRGNTGSANQIP